MAEETTVPGTPDNAGTTQTTPPADWRAALPEDIRGEATLGKFSDLGSFAKSYVNLERMLGNEKVPKPKTDFDPGNPEWQMFLDAAGRPKSADEYKFAEAQMPDGLTYDGKLEGAFKSVFHTAGLNGKQAQMLRDAFVAYQVENYQAGMTEIENDANARREAMKRELGSGYDGWAKAADVAQKEFVSDTLMEKITQAGLHRDPEWTKVLGKIGKAMIGEEKLKTQGGASMDTPADFKTKSDEYRATHASALFNPAHPEHKLRSEELWRLTQRAFPE